MAIKQGINNLIDQGDVQPAQESFAYCQTCKKILGNSENLNEVKQTAEEHKLQSGFADHQTGFTLESYILND
ncbi:MAG TPA: hypothetical protein DDW50_14245 [Firmicutes bacterium]|jgi:hypothetical protein|nr:hypothetical protein [Bacillota bacterium]